MLWCYNLIKSHELFCESESDTIHIHNQHVTLVCACEHFDAMYDTDIPTFICLSGTRGLLKKWKYTFSKPYVVVCNNYSQF